jgi:nitrile hydratase accessory protein
MPDPASSRDQSAVGADAPRRNGELVFEEPWQSRAFGIVVALTENKTCAYEEFRQRLIANIGQWDQQHAATPEAVYHYYERWLESLERLVTEHGLLTEVEIHRRAELLHESDHHETGSRGQRT